MHKEIIPPEEIGPFQDEKFGPLIDLWPRKMKTSGRKISNWPPVRFCLENGTHKRNGKNIKVIRVDRDTDMSDPNANVLFYLGIGHFKNNNYRQRSPYVFWYDDQLWCRITSKSRKYWSKQIILWMKREYIVYNKYRDPVYVGLYPIQSLESANDRVNKRLTERMEMLASGRFM